MRYQSFTLTEPILMTQPGDTGTLAFLARVGQQDMQMLIVNNAGRAGSLLTGTVSEVNADPFAGPMEETSFGLGSSASRDFTFTFSPIDRGDYSDSVLVQTNVGTHAITLAGSAVGPVVATSEGPGSTIDLGEGSLNETLETILRISNITPDDNGGIDSLTALTLDYSLSGEDASLFTLDLVPQDILNKGDQLDVTITFFGSNQPGDYSATLTLFTDEGAALGDLLTGQQYMFTLSASVIPEPSLAAWGLLGVAFMRDRRRCHAARRHR